MRFLSHSARAIGDVRAGSAHEGEELLVRRCIRRSMADPLGRRHLSTRRAAASQRDSSVRSGRGKKGTRSLPFSGVERTGRLRQEAGRAAESPAEARTYGDGGGLWPSMRW
jgi:hypothetical protein